MRSPCSVCTWTKATGAWAMVDGLAFLHLDGKLDTQDPVVVEARVRGACLAILTAASTRRDGHAA